MMSEPEWKGNAPQRFSGGKKHIQPQNEISQGLSMSSHRSANLGIRTYSHSPTPEAAFKPHQKIFEEQYNFYTPNIDPKGIKCVKLPEQKERVRP